MLLRNVYIAGQQGLNNILVRNGKISIVKDDDPLIQLPIPYDVLSFENAIAFPGLINSHDHLDFDLFPRLGAKIYNNYTEWGSYIHKEYKEQISGILKVPEKLRITWGLYKNLLAGVTTVVNHGKRIIAGNNLITVYQDCQSLHSLATEKNWKVRLNKFLRRSPAVIHIGEGTDNIAKQEIDSLIKWNIFRRNIIGIHGIGMNEKQASSFKALVWCPDSNYFMFNKTASINTLKQSTTILFGSDSTLTASWNIWDHLRLARNTGMVTDSALFDMLTTRAADIWGIENTGSLADDQWADIVVAKARGNSGSWSTFYDINPEDILLVLHRGNTRLIDKSIIEQRKPDINTDNFSKISVNGSCKYVQGDVAGLIKEIHTYNSDINFPVGFD